MRKTVLFLTIVLLLWACAPIASAQEMLGDLLEGKLVDPEVGAFAWYDLEDSSTGRRFFLRQAIVDSERVGLKKGWWLETEIQPDVGFPIIYKMLLTGPASDPDNVKRLVVQSGNQPPQEMPYETPDDSGSAAPGRELVGAERVKLPDEVIEAQHYLVGEGETQYHLWVNEDVGPMGLVRLESEKGELMLRRYGVGGPDGQSAIGRKAAEGEDVRVEVESGVSKNFSGRTESE